MQLNYSEAKLLSHVLETNGEKVKNDKGEEVSAPRTLNGEESSQRGHFTKNTKELFESTEKEIKEVYDKHNAVVKEVRDEVEKNEKKGKNDKKGEKKDEKLDEVYLNGIISADQRVKDSFKGVQDTLNALLAKKEEVKVEEKTKKVLVKYFTEYGDKIGFLKGDDETVTGVAEALK